MRIGPGRLKCVSVWSATRSLREAVEEVLGEHVDAAHIRHLYGDVYLVYTEAEAAAVRDWLAPGLEDGESAFVVDFERWSTHGPHADRDWLLARGH